MDYGKKTTTTTNDDDTTTIREEAYFDGLKSIVESTRVDVAINRNNIITELMRCLELVKLNTPDVVIRISKDKDGEPRILQKTWDLI